MKNRIEFQWGNKLPGTSSEALLDNKIDPEYHLPRVAASWSVCGDSRWLRVPEFLCAGIILAVHS